jgi:phosphoribosylamine--glycine ligase
MLDWAMRCQDWGHEVVWFDQKKKDGNVRLPGKGIVPKLQDFELLRKKYIGWADLIVLPDNTVYLDLLEPYRQMGYPIFGPCAAAAEWELDREKGQRIMKDAGLNVIPGIEFNDFEAAAKYVEKNQECTVCKPSGDADKVLSYVGYDAASLIYMLRDRWSKKEKYVNDAKQYGFILQEKKTGCEFAVGGWFGPDGWSEPWCENFEFKKFMDGDRGPTTGEQGTLVQYVKKSKLADIALLPVTDELKAIGYVGYVDISGCIDREGEFWPFEYTMRPGWPIFHNQVSLHYGDPAQWMLDKVNGYDTLRVMYDTCSISVVLSIPDYPKETSRETDGIPVYGCGDREHIHPVCMMAEEGWRQMGDKVVCTPIYKTAGNYVLVVTGTGETITGARRSAYAALKKVRIATQDEQHRWDIGKGRLVKQLPKIQKFGFAKDFMF